MTGRMRRTVDSVQEHTYRVPVHVALGTGIAVIIWSIIYVFTVVVQTQGSISNDTSQMITGEVVLANSESLLAAPPMDTREHIIHKKIPVPLKAIYMTSCVVGTESLRSNLVAVAEETEINAIIIDIKDFSGTLSFNPGTTTAWYPAWEHARCGARDMKRFIADLHQKSIYVIGRITVFQDPFYTVNHPEDAVKKSDGVTVWKDHKGISFVDVGAKAYWKQLVDLAVLSYNIGFDELNFDYIRYPSDGNMTDITHPQAEASEYGTDKAANLEAFFSYLKIELDNPEKYQDVIHEEGDKQVPWTSADLFGMTTSAADDMNIGQVFERALPYFDFIAPMVYPSHYPKGYIGMNNPNSDPYRVVAHAMGEGVQRAVATTTAMDGLTHTRIGTTTPPIYEKKSHKENLRTWIQDFNYGGVYGPKEIRAQILASEDVGVTSWMIWSPSNNYTRDALRGEE